MKFSSPDNYGVRFTFHDERILNLKNRIGEHPEIAELISLGESEEGRQIAGLKIGNGDKKISLMAGAHADEPVGPETLAFLADQMLIHATENKELLDTFTFFIIPHINPDGEMRNKEWIERFPDPVSLIKYRDREPPGRDIEFGYPDMRPENRAASNWWKENAPFELHINLHGMPISEGALLLIDKDSVQETKDLQRWYQQYIRDSGFGFHDHDRKGEKGFTRIGTGLSTTPESEKMKAHFKNSGDDETASLFHQNSMEYLKSHGGNTISLVTEFPLFKLPSTAEECPGYPENYFSWQEQQSLIQQRVEKGKPIKDLLDSLSIQQISLSDGMKMQLKIIELALSANALN